MWALMKRPVATKPKVVPLWRARAHRPPTGGCAKCGSTYVAREPAFIHCRFCGSLSRIPNGSLLDQEVFEIRSGLRLAS
jgi:hypothetical protein